MLTISDLAGDGNEIVVTALKAQPAPPSVVSPPPIVLDLTPQPIETMAQVTVRYAIKS